jgi:hypothetical protein
MPASNKRLANKGFSDMRNVAARSNISCTLIGNRPQSLTCHTANRKRTRQQYRKKIILEARVINGEPPDLNF